MSEKSFDIGVIGGGASGLASAIYASTKNSRVAIFEKNERVGKKILVTGNSRCNLSNKNLSLSNYFGDHAFIKKVFDSRSQTEVMSFFDRLGIEIEITEDGRMFPASFQASSVLDALRFRCEEQGVTVITGCEAMSVKRLKEGFEIESSMHDTYFVKKVIISTGGLAGTECSSKKLFSIPQSLGHTTVEAHSSLVQLHLEGALFKSMEGNRWICKAMVVSNNEIAAEDKNEVLFTNYGVSGSAVLNVSRFAVKSLYEGKKQFYDWIFCLIILQMRL